MTHLDKGPNGAPAEWQEQMGGASRSRLYCICVRMDFKNAVRPVRNTRFGEVPRDASPDSTSRTAVYAIRTYGGKGGALRKGRPYPDLWSLQSHEIHRVIRPLGILD